MLEGFQGVRSFGPYDADGRKPLRRIVIVLPAWLSYTWQCVRNEVLMGSQDLPLRCQNLHQESLYFSPRSFLTAYFSGPQSFGMYRDLIFFQIFVYE